MQYLASPYTENPQENYEIVCRVVYNAITLHRSNWFSPIVYMHDMARQFKGPIDWESYASFNHHMLKASAGLIILASEGWERSVGVQKEYEWARNMQMPYSFVDEYGRLTLPMEQCEWL